MWTGQHGSNVGGAIANGSCDFTGDGKQDVVVGDWLWNRTPYGEVGAAYVVPNGAKSGQLDDPTSGAIRIDGSQQEQSVGFRLNCAGDVNGDKIDDIVVDEANSSRAWVVFGSTDTADLSLEFLGDRGFAIDRGKGELALDKGVDTPVTGVGDLNGDGFADIAIASQNAGGKAGQVTVVKGRDDIATVDSSDDDEVLMRIDGAADRRVTRVQPAGDVDGDGVGDLIVAAPDAKTPHQNVTMTGSAWIVSGKSRGKVDVAKGDFDGFAIKGPADRRQRLGIWLAAAGDVNHDGLDDVLIGAPSLGLEGGAAVVLGSKSHDTVYTDPDAANGHAVWTGTEPGSAPTSTATTPATTSAPVTSSPVGQGESPAGDDDKVGEDNKAGEAAQAPADTTTDRGWWLRDSATGKGNNMGFTVAAAPATDNYVGALAVGIFVKHKTVAITADALGDDPVVDFAAVAADKKVVLEGQNKFLGRALGIVSDFGTGSCPLMAVGSAGSDNNGDVQLHALPGADEQACTTAATTEPTDGTDQTDGNSQANGGAGSSGSDSNGSGSNGSSDKGADGNGHDGNAQSGNASSDSSGDSDGSSNGSDDGTDDNAGGQPDGKLPKTGATVLGSALAGAVLIALGALAVVRARRRQK